MGLNGYRLWVMGQLDFNVQSPTVTSSANRSAGCGGRRAVVAQVEYEERHILKPVFSLYRL
jgi:hypothetical protein